MNVNEIQYKRADITALAQKLERITDKVKAARNGREVADLRASALDIVKSLSTAAMLAEIRFAQDVSDEFYLGEKEYYDTHLPAFNAQSVKLQRAILSSAHLPDALNYFSENVAKIYEISIKSMDERIVKDAAQEAELVTKYQTLTSGMLFPWKGKSMPLSEFCKYFNDADRRTRAQSTAVLGKTLSSHSAQLDGIFDKLVRVRNKKAKKMGLADYSEMGDWAQNRYAYGRREITEYRNRVLVGVTPKVCGEKAVLARELGITDFKCYDNEIYFKRGNPQPKGDTFSAARKMYSQMSEQTRKFFIQMESADAFDLTSRKNKWGGGFCTKLDDYGQPFILANFNGTSGDVDVLTHEFGHAFAFSVTAKQDYELESTMTMSVAEVHSMAMEFLAYPYADLFFDRPDDYRKMHRSSALAFMPYGCAVDEFEESVYRNGDMSASERNKLWLDIDKKYRPYMSYDGIPYLEKGTRWQYQSHIYETPMYYIDYVLAQAVAFEILELSQTSYADAFAKYMRFIENSTLSFPELTKKLSLTFLAV